jgi:hypothetical protein
MVVMKNFIFTEFLLVGDVIHANGMINLLVVNLNANPTDGMQDIVPSGRKDGVITKAGQVTGYETNVKLRAAKIEIIVCIIWFD